MKTIGLTSKCNEKHPFSHYKGKIINSSLIKIQIVGFPVIMYNRVTTGEVVSKCSIVLSSV